MRKEPPLARRAGSGGSSARYDLAYVFSAPLVERRAGGDEVRVLQQLDIQAEREIIRGVVKSCQRRVRFVESVATVASVSDIFSRGLRALHYSGHGTKNAVTFEKGLGRDGDPTRASEMHVVKGKELQKLLEASRVTQNLKLVFVSACHSESVGQCFVKAGVDHVVAIDTNYGVLDTAAKVFCRSLYSALLAGKTVREAFDTAQQTVRMEPAIREPFLEAAKFKLLPEVGDGDMAHNVSIFGDLADGALSRPESIDARARHNAVPPPVAYFRSREEIVYATIASMMRPPSAANGAHRGVLLLSGLPGVGKSEVARYVCHWFSERRHFAALYFVDGNDVADDLRETLVGRGKDAHAPETPRKTMYRALRRIVAKALRLHERVAESEDEATADLESPTGRSSSGSSGGEERGGGLRTASRTASRPRRQTAGDIASELSESEGHLALLASNGEYFARLLNERFSDGTAEHLLVIDNADALVHGHGTSAAQCYFADFVNDLVHRRAPALSTLVTARENILRGGSGGERGEHVVLDVPPLSAIGAGEIMLRTLPSTAIEWLHASEERFFFGVGVRDAAEEGGGDGPVGDGADAGAWAVAAKLRMADAKTTAVERHQLRCEALARGPLGRYCRGLPDLIHCLRHIAECYDGDVTTLHSPKTIDLVNAKVAEHHIRVLRRRPSRSVAIQRDSGSPCAGAGGAEVAGRTDAAGGVRTAAALLMARAPSSSSAIATARGEMLWDFFLSHYQAEFGDAVNIVAIKLEALGFRPWFDQWPGKGSIAAGRVDVTAEGMQRGVRNAAVFVLFLTKGIFTRPYCRLEIITAIKAGRPILTLKETDARRGAFDFSAAKAGVPRAFHPIVDRITSDIMAIPLRRDEGEQDLMLNKIARMHLDRTCKVITFDDPSVIAAAEAADATTSAARIAAVHALLPVAEDAAEWLRLAAREDDTSTVEWGALQGAMHDRFERVVLSRTPPGVQKRFLAASDFAALESYTRRHPCGPLVSAATAARSSGATAGGSASSATVRGSGSARVDPRAVTLSAWSSFLYMWFEPWMELVSFILPAWNCFVGYDGAATGGVSAAAGSVRFARPQPFVGGFVSTAVANAAMQSKGIGSFLLRFSSTQPHAIAIVYHDSSLVSAHGVPPIPKQTLTTLESTPDGRRRLCLKVKGSPTLFFDSLGAMFEAPDFPAALTQLCSMGVDPQGVVKPGHSDYPKSDVLQEWRKAKGETRAPRLATPLTRAAATGASEGETPVQKGPAARAMRGAPRPARLSRHGSNSSVGSAGSIGSPKT